MASTIAFTDGIGAATLKNAKPTPADRFASWTLLTKPIGDTATRQADGVLTMFVLRTDYGASFELQKIPVRLVGGVRMVDVAARLVAWLLQGGACTVTTGDADANVYTCGLMPGTTPSLAFADKKNLEYTLSVSLINRAAAAMVCHYA